jgi:hypothetical protein
MPSSHKNRESDSNVIEAGDLQPEKHHLSRNSSNEGSEVKQLPQNALDSSRGHRESDSNIIDASEGDPEKRYSSRNSTEAGR